MILRPHRKPIVLAVSTLLSYCILIFRCHNAVVLVQANASYSHSIPYGQEECLLIRVPKDQPYIISGSFECLDTRFTTDPIRVALYNSDEKRLWSSSYGDADGSFSQKGTGKHWLCLENGLTYAQQEDLGPKRNDARQKVTRTIGFAYRVKKSVAGMMSETLGEKGDGATSNDIDGTTRKLMQLADDLNENFQVLTDHMSFMKAREVVHRQLHEQTSTKVVRWNILEICTVVVVTFGQVLNVWWILSKRNSSYY